LNNQGLEYTLQASVNVEGMSVTHIVGENTSNRAGIDRVLDSNRCKVIYISDSALTPGNI